MTPRALFRLDVPEGTRLVVCALYNDEDVDGEVVRAWEEGRSEVPPFVWRSAGYEPLQDITGRSRSRVAEDLSRLVALGVIRRATREGRRGWELLGTRREPAASPAGRPSGGTRGSQSADAKVPPAGPRRPSAGTRPTPSDVPPAGPPGPTGRTPTSQRWDPARAREGIKQEPDLARRGGAANDRPGQVSAAPSSSTATSSRTTPEPARRTALPVGEPVPPRPASREGPPRALLLRLVRHFDEQFVPTIDGRPVEAGGTPLESRRVHADVDTLRRLAELLTPPEDVDDYAVEVWRERRVASVTAYVDDYAKICAVDPEQARQWGGDMLEPRIRTGVRSAWQTLTRIVDRWREEQAAAAAAARDAAAEARRAEARAVAERLAELEQLARHGEPAFARELRAAGQVAPPLRDHAADHAAAAAAVAAALAAGREPTLAEVTAAVAVVPACGERPATTPLPPLPPMQHVGEPPVRELSEGDEAEIRERGRQREARASTGVDEQRARQRINEVFREFRERVGRSPTPEEADEIRRQVRGVEGATGT